jgi:group I intron endonuclease
MNNIIGIYKILSPSNKVYIGQSLDISIRWKKYKRLNCKAQPKLYASFNFYGVENHIFEILEECSIEMLNERERYWQEYYDVLSENGLNCKLTETNDRSGELSNESRLNMSNAQKNLYQKGYEVWNKGIKGEKSHWFGRKHTEKTKKKMSENQKNMSYETKKKIGEKNKGKKHTETQNKNHSNYMKKMYENGFLHPNGKKVINTETGEVYKSAAECERKTVYKNLIHRLNGRRKNDTSFKYL